jgi:hypothetical protein
VSKYNVAKRGFARGARRAVVLTHGRLLGVVVGRLVMAEVDGIKMRIIALDELMKCCVEIGRNSDKQEHKDFAKAMYEAARTRHDFLKSSHDVENHNR